MKRLACLCLIGLYFASTAAAVTIDTVPIGNPGNAPDTEVMFTDETSGYGSVGYAYQIGKYEVTAGQYTEFLNAVADADPNGLYNTAMSSGFGANIQRTGSSLNFSYSVAADWADRPVNYVSFWDAARFANWLHNNQPTGPQGPGTTEDGAYLNVDNQTTFARQPGAKFFIPTEDEWYKAAYHDQSAGLSASYFDYPTGTNAVPGNDINETSNPGNNANYDINNYAIGSPYYRTVAGEFELSDSPYGTFDQGGNIWEWNETNLYGSLRGLRGGSFIAFLSDDLHASDRGGGDPSVEFYFIGFRAASIPDLPGDFNHDGTVDSADYVVWRKNPGGIYTQNDYNTWRADFGQTLGSGATGWVSSGSSALGIPEPAACMLVALGLGGVIISRPRPRHGDCCTA